MATMHPESLETVTAPADVGPTEGERVVFRALRDALRPDREYSCFYETVVRGNGSRRWPDFVVLGQRLGLFVIEVKDWRIDQIAEFNPSHVRFRNPKSTQRQNPERQAKAYADLIIDELRQHGVRATGQGSKIPVGCVIALPFIHSADYRERHFDDVLPSEHILFADDLDPSTDRFVGRDDDAFPARLAGIQVFECPRLTSHDVKRIEDVLWPNRVGVPVRLADNKGGFQEDVKYLDKWQARVARRLDLGHQLLKGPPGSGKTLVLVHRLKYLSLFNPTAKRILLVCYNIALASYLRRLVQEQGVAIGPDIQILHFFELCSKVLGEKVDYHHDEPANAQGYYDTVVAMAQEALDGTHAEVEAFDAILVDEGQDFDDSQLRVIRGLLREDGDLVVALDTEQDLYHAKRKLEGTWKSLGINIQGHVTKLSRAYRSTRALRELSRRLAGAGRIDGPPASNNQQDLPFGAPIDQPGNPPELVASKDQAALCGALVARLHKSITDDGYTRAEIAVLYDDKDYSAPTSPAGFRYGDQAIGEGLRDAIQAGGLPVQWVSEDVHAKRLFDVTRDSVVLSSVHSAKGLDFELVCLVHPGWPDVARKDIRARLGPTYVAVTRAKYELVVFCEREDWIVRRIRESGAVAASRRNR